MGWMGGILAKSRPLTFVFANEIRSRETSTQREDKSLSGRPVQGRIQTVATVARVPVRFSSSDFKPKSKFTKKCLYLRFPSLQRDVFFFSVYIKFFKSIKDLMLSFSVHLLLYTLLNLYILILSELFRYTMIRLLEVASVPTVRNCARIGLLRSV